MRDAVKGYLTLAAGLTEVTRQRATSAARALVSQGEATAEQVGALVEDLLDQSRQNRAAVSALVTSEVDRALARLGLAAGDEVAALVERVRALESQVRELRAASAGGSSTATAEQPAAKKATTKQAPARRAAATKAAATKAGGKQAPSTRATSGGRA